MGDPCQEHTVKVVDDGGQELSDLKVGSVLVQGSSIMTGYFNNPEDTEKTLQPGNWLDTGDLGFLFEGDLYVTGRRTDVIIVNGRNIRAQDIEELAELQPEVRTREASAFGITDSNDITTIVLVIECRLTSVADRQSLTNRLQRLVYMAFGVNCLVELVSPHTLPRTSSGKLSRFAARQGFIQRTQPTDQLSAESGKNNQHMSGSWVAVTGATGFIGRVLLQSLISEGWKVKALTRRPRVGDEVTQWIEGDLDNHQALRNLVEGVSAVVHCAGQVRGSSLEDFIHTNVDGTGNLVRASIEQSSPPRFLLISSLAARQPELSWYAASKRMAEQLVIDHSQRMPYAVFRPTAVYGPGDKEMSPLFRATRLGLLPMVGQSGMRFGLLHVNDLVAAITCWLSTKNPVQGVYELDDGTPGGYNSQSVAVIAQEVWKRPVHCIFFPRHLFGWSRPLIYGRRGCYAIPQC